MASDAIRTRTTTTIVVEYHGAGAAALGDNRAGTRRECGGQKVAGSRAQIADARRSEAMQLARQPTLMDRIETCETFGRALVAPASEWGGGGKMDSF